MRRAARLLPWLLAAALSSRAPADEMRSAERAVIQALERARPSVVTVFTEDKNDFDLSGVVISSGGCILTLRSPFVGAGGKVAERVMVRFPGKGDTEEATVVGEDAATDTILLRAKGARNRAIKAGRAADVQHGMWVLLVGNAFGAGRESTATASLGVISGIERSGETTTRFHASALVNPGSFGAPLLDLSGALVGITAPAVTAAGHQSVIVPFELIRDAYRAKGGDAAKEFAAVPVARRPGGEIADAFGTVAQAAAAEGAKVLVAVRAQPEAGGTVAAPPPPPAEGGAPPAATPPQGPPMPDPVPGALPGLDRSSGVIVDADGLILCPLRVVGWPGPPRPLIIDLLDGRSLPATLLGYDERLRVALLSVEARGLPVLADAPEADLRAGRLAVALGFPHEAPGRQTPQLTAGILSRTGALSGLHPGFRALQTDAGVGGGNRGGPLLDAEGRLLGVLLDVNDTEPMGYGMRVRGGYAGNAGLGFALPMAVVRAILPRLRRGDILRAAFLGVGVDDVPEGVSVTSVSAQNSKGEASAAATAGLREGDLLVSIDQRPLRRAADLREIVAAYAVGDEVEIVVTREGASLTVRARLTER